MRGPDPLWGMTSQAVNSANNLAIAILIARSSTTSEFGAWATAYAIYVLALQIGRAVVSTPLLISHDVQLSLPRGERSNHASAALAVGSVFSLIQLGASFFLPSTVRMAAVIFAIAIPGLVLVDFLRHLAFKEGRSHRAVILDSLWLCSLLVGAGLAASTRSSAKEVVLITASWSLIGAAIGFASLIATKVTPSPQAARRNIYANRHITGKLMVESVLGTGVLQLLPGALSLAAGFAVSGGVRAAQTVFGVTTFIMMGLNPQLTTAAVSRIKKGRSLIPIVTFMSSAVAVACGLVWLALTIHPALGKILVGESWSALSGLLVPAALASALRGPYNGVPIVLRASHLIGDAIRLRASCAIPSLLFPVVGALMGDLTGAMWGYALGAAANALQSIWALRKLPPSQVASA